MNRNIEIIYNPPILNPNSIYNQFCNKPYKQTYTIMIKYNIIVNQQYDPLLNQVLNKQLNPLLNSRFKINNKIPLMFNIPIYKQLNPISFIFNKM